MRFLIGSTYDQGGDSERPPCAGAQLLESPERQEGGDQFRSSFIWSIEINSLDELLELVEKKGRIVLFPGNSIEIYEGHRE